MEGKKRKCVEKCTLHKCEASVSKTRREEPNNNNGERGAHKRAKISKMGIVRSKQPFSKNFEATSAEKYKNVVDKKSFPSTSHLPMSWNFFFSLGERHHAVSERGGRGRG